MQMRRAHNKGPCVPLFTLDLLICSSETHTHTNVVLERNLQFYVFQETEFFLQATLESKLRRLIFHRRQNTWTSPIWFPECDWSPRQWTILLSGHCSPVIPLPTQSRKGSVVGPLQPLRPFKVCIGCLLGTEMTASVTENYRGPGSGHPRLTLMCQRGSQMYFSWINLLKELQS